MNTTNKLLTILIIAVAILILLSAAQLNQASQPYKAPSLGADNVMHSVDNPVLKEELNARIMAPAVQQQTVGAR